MTTFNKDSEGVEVVKEFNRNVEGKTILITGASVYSLGAATAVALAHGNPAHILLLARSAHKIDPVISDISNVNQNIKVNFVQIELDKLDSVQQAAATIENIVEKIDLFINNAGIMAVRNYTTNTEGVELHLATNHVGHFLLTNLLMNKILAAGEGARILNVTSGAYMISPFRFDDYNFSDGKDYDRWSGYGQSKTANILFTRELASRLQSKGVQAFAVHPGLIFDTRLGIDIQPAEYGETMDITNNNKGTPFFPGNVKSREQGVSTTLVAALDPNIASKSGSYMEDCAIQEARDYATSAENARKLWKLSEQLVNQRFDF